MDKPGSLVEKRKIRIKVKGTLCLILKYIETSIKFNFKFSCKML